MINLGKFKLREEYQLPIHNATLDHLRTKDAKPAFIDASVGSGKTLSIAAIAKHTQEKGPIRIKFNPLSSKIAPKWHLNSTQIAPK